MRLALVFTILAGCLSSPAWSKEPTTMTGPEARAIAVAYTQFTKDLSETKILSDSKIEDYAVTVSDVENTFEVAFVPSGGVAEAGKGWINFGGGVHYFVEKNTYKVIRRFFSR